MACPEQVIVVWIGSVSSFTSLSERRTIWQGCQISPLFHEDAQDDQAIYLIILRGRGGWDFSGCGKQRQPRGIFVSIPKTSRSNLGGAKRWFALRDDLLRAGNFRDVFAAKDQMDRSENCIEDRAGQPWISANATHCRVRVICRQVARYARSFPGGGRHSGRFAEKRAL